MKKLLIWGSLALFACSAGAAVRTLAVEHVRGREATVSFGPGAAATNVLVMAWGPSAGGATIDSWAHHCLVGAVRPEDKARAVTLPNNWGSSDAQALRFFLCDGWADAGYVTDGLLMRLDAIDNAGTGVHDPESTVWKDLAGSYDFTLMNSPVWTAGNRLSVNGASAFVETALPECETLEAVFESKRHQIGGQIIFTPGRKAPDNSNVDYMLCDFHGSLQMTAPRTFGAPLPTDRVALVTGEFEEHTLTRLWGDGWPQNLTYLDESWGTGEGIGIIGARSRTEEKYGWQGDLYAIRLYGRKLTPTEVVQNHVTDLVRFFGLPNAVTETASSASVAYAAGVEVVETVYDGASKPVAVTVAFSGVTAPAELVMAWDAAEKGETPSAWANSKLAAVIHPDTTTRTFDLPKNWGTSVLALRFFLRTGITHADYVTNGLVNSWDGIDNTGTGVHDPAATVWKDRAGSHDLTVHEGVTWAGDGLVVNGPSAHNDNPTSKFRTLELVCTPSKPQGYFVFSSGRKAADSDTNLSRAALFEMNGEIFYTDGSRETRFALTKARLGVRLAVSSTCSDNGTVSAAMSNGEPATLGSRVNYWGFREATTVIGSRQADTSDYPWYGTLHALRLYSRELSQDERLQNYRADLERFFGVTPTADAVAASAAYAYEMNPPGSPVVTETAEEGPESELFRVDLRTGAREVIRSRELLPLTWSAAQLDSVTAPYTTDGLINRWDGIDNAGTGVHDSFATVWKDLAGNLDMTILTNGKWKVNALVCAGAAAQATNKASAYTTIETAYKMTASGSRIMVTSGLNTRFVVFDWIDGNKNVEEYFDGATDTLTIKRAHQMDVMHTSAAVYNGNAVSAIYSEGVKDTSGYKQKNGWGVGDGKMMVGDRKNGKEYPWTGEIYAIRLYNRALTDAEIANDRLIDMLRFDAKPLLENLPSGVTFSVTAIEMEGEGDDLTTWTPKAGGRVEVLADKAPAGSRMWYPADKGVWKLKLEFYGGDRLLRTDESLFDLRHYHAGLSLILR